MSRAVEFIRSGFCYKLQSHFLLYCKKMKTSSLFVKINILIRIGTALCATIVHCLSVATRHQFLKNFHNSADLSGNLIVLHTPTG